MNFDPTTIEFLGYIPRVAFIALLITAVWLKAKKYPVRIIEDTGTSSILGRKTKTELTTTSTIVSKTECELTNKEQEDLSVYEELESKQGISLVEELEPNQ